MVDDDRLLELLKEALAPGPTFGAVPSPPEPAPERVAAVRLLAEEGATSASPPAPSASPPEPVAPTPIRPGRGHRAGWLAAGVSVAAAAVVIAMLVLPSLVDGRGGNTTSADRSGSPAAVVRLRAALMSGNPVAIAKADANLLREEKSIASPERDQAVAAHVEAIQFLRDHPSADAAAQLRAPASLDVTPPAEPITVAPSGDPDPGTPEPVPTTLAVPPPAVNGPPSVTILAVEARLDGTFAVEFTVSGFTPDASGAPGTYSVTFSFDDGQAPATWDGPSPWSFPVTGGVAYHQVCAHVADADGVVDRSTGGCRDIV